MIIDSALKKSPMTQLTEFSDSIARMPPKAWQWRSYVNDPFLSTINNSTHPISNIYISITIMDIENEDHFSVLAEM